MSVKEEDTCMSYEEEDTYHRSTRSAGMSVKEEDTCMSYEEQDTYLVHLACLVMVLPTRIRGELSELPKPRPLTVTVVAP
jgi:hypothetical protein